MRALSLRPSPHDVITHLATSIAGSAARTLEIGGRIGFRVLGDEGGAWIVDLDHPGGSWSTPEDPDDIEECHTRVYAYASIFPVLLSDVAAVKVLIERGDVVIQGDCMKLMRLSKLMDH